MKCIAFMLFLTASAVADSPPAGLWQEQENYAGVVRGNWTFNPTTRTFQARWSNGSEAQLRLEELDANHIVITRVDSTGPCAGLRVRYEGQPAEQGYSGQVTWYWSDQARRGTWSVRLPEEARKP